MAYIKEDFAVQQNDINVTVSYFDTIRYYKNQLDEAIKRLALLQEEIVYVPESFKEHLVHGIDEQQKYIDYLKRSFENYKEMVVLQGGLNHAENIKE